ncbi:MAG: cytochrome c oxidase subunit I [Phototrophicaceae bacterium]
MATISVPARQQIKDEHPEQRFPSLGELASWTVDHKIIGLQYAVTSFFFFIIGGALALMIRWELLTPDLDFMGSGQAYNQLFTIHGTVMIFLFIIPMIGALGNYVVPLQLGAKDMAFPWLNAFAFWLIPPAGVMLLLGYAIGQAEAGWTSYPPLSTVLEYSGDGQTMWAMSLHLLGISSIAGSINFIVTILNMRPKEMGIWQMPLLCWAVLATSIIVVMATPFLTAALTLLLFDRVAGTTFFLPSAGGDVLLWQNIFWFYSHPAVYIMVLPLMGVLSEVLSVHSRKPVFGYRMIAMSSMAIALIGFTVWAHHMFTSLQPQLRIPFMITTMIIAVPTGIKIFSWLGTIWGGKIRYTSAMLFSLGFLSMFVIGGISGVMLAAIPWDVHVHDTYFVVAHFHFVLFGGSVFGIYSALYHWYPKMTGRMMNEFWGQVHFALTYVGFFFTFFPMHMAGMLGMPRRVAVYTHSPELQTLNVIATIAAIVLGFSTIIFVWNAIASFYMGKLAGANPWRALTLEWATTSPPPPTNFDEDPIPFEDPYGYGTEASVAYLDAIDRHFGLPEEGVRPRGFTGGIRSTAPAPSGD